MIRFVGQANLVAVLLAASAPCVTIGQKTTKETSPPAIYVRTYDYADVPPSTLGIPTKLNTDSGMIPNGVPD